MQIKDQLGRYVASVPAYDSNENVVKIAMLRWNTGTLAWEKFTGSVSVAPAADVSVTNFPSTYAVTGALTDAQLRAAVVPVSGTVAATQSGTWAVSAVSLPLPSGASTEATLALIKAKTDNLDVALSTRTKPADTQPVSGTFWQANQPVTASPSHQTRQDTFTAAANGTIVTLVRAHKSFSVQAKGTGAAATAWDVRLEGSLDGVNFEQVLQHLQTTGDGVVLFSGSVLTPCLFFRSRCHSITLGVASNIVVTILGAE